MVIVSLLFKVFISILNNILLCIEEKCKAMLCGLTEWPH